MSTRLNTLWAAGLLSLMTMVGCGGGGGGGGGNDVQPAMDLSGTWDFTTQQTANSCDTLDPEPSSLVIEIVQNGAELTLTDLGSGDVIDGSISGTTVTLRMVQEFDDAGGLGRDELATTPPPVGGGGDLARVEFDATLDAGPNGDVLSGAGIARAFLFGEEVCAIEDSWSGSRRTPVPTPPTTLDVAGTWEVVGDVVTDPCGIAGAGPIDLEWELVQTGAEIEIIDSGVGTTATGTLVGAALTFSGTVGDPEFSITVDGDVQFSPDAQSFSGSYRVVLQTPDEACEVELTLSGTRAPIAPPPPAPAFDLTGDWSFTFTPTADGCPELEASQSTATLFHSGDQVTLVADGFEMTGTVVGDQLTFQEEPEAGFGMTLVLTVSSDGSALIGTYTVTIDGSPCDLIAAVEGVRI